MTIKELVAPLEAFAPPASQEEYDNSGLIVGRADAEIKCALVCVDITEAVMDEAKKLGAGLVISHHPIIFHPLKRLNSASYVERTVEHAIRNNIAIYACHTNLDSAPRGMSHRLADILGVENVDVLAEGFGAVGTLPHPVEAKDFLRTVAEKLQVKAIRHSEIASGAKVQKIAVCTGSGGGFIETAKSRGADLYLTADLKYNDFPAADGEIIVADAGHFETEFCAIELIRDVISKKFPTFATYAAKSSLNPVNYLVSDK